MNVADDLFQVREREDGIVHNLHWFDVIVPQYNDDTFRSHCRMSRATYVELENLIRPRIGNILNDVIPLRKKIMSTIWLLATPESFRSVADRFGIAQSDEHNVFTQIIAILKELLSVFVTWPNPEECEENARVFRRRSRGFPNIVGAIDGSHISIKQPPGNANDYYNRKGRHSIILQGTCDHRAKFIDCLIGRPGRAHDAAVLRSSPLFERMTDRNNPLLPPGQHIIGDSAYPLLQNLMTPFRDNGHLTDSQIRYNVRLSFVRSIIERAFGLLKVKWRRLLYLDVQSVEMGNNIIAAACMLHNFLIIRGEINHREPLNLNNYDMNDNILDEIIEMDDESNGRTKRLQIMNNL